MDPTNINQPAGQPVADVNQQPVPPAPTGAEVPQAPITEPPVEPQIPEAPAVTEVPPQPAV